MTDTDRPDLDAIAAREQAATDGPWGVETIGSSLMVMNRGRGTVVAILGDASDPQAEPDAEFLAAARTEVPALLGEVRRLTAERDEALAAFAAVKEESATLQQEYAQPAEPRVNRCRACRQHETVDREEARARALAKTARRYKRERDEARDATTAHRGTREIYDRTRALPDEDTPTTDGPQVRFNCGRCRAPFDHTDTSFNGRSRHRNTPWCRRCVDRCHEGGADHKCPICAPTT